MANVKAAGSSDRSPADRSIDFDVYNPPAAESDYYAGWPELAGKGELGIVWTSRNGGHWIPTRSDVLEEVMTDYNRFSYTTQVIPKALSGDIKLLPTLLDPPEHRPYRRLLNDLLSPRAVRLMESEIRDEARRLIDAFADRGWCDFTAEYAEKLPINVFLRLLDLPMEDAPRLKQWSDNLLRPDPHADWSPDSSGFARGLRLFSEYLDPFITERRQKHGSDMLSRLVNSPVGTREMTQSEALQLSVQVLIAGLDTVVNFLGFAMLHLAQNNSNRTRLLNDPAVMPVAVEELLRRFPIVVTAREATRDMDFHGAQIRKGDIVATPTQLGAVDEGATACPMHVDFDRARQKHVTFGAGDHRCPGAHLARAEIRITLEEWMRRIPEFRVREPGAVAFTGGIVAVVNSLKLAWEPAETGRG